LADAPAVWARRGAPVTPCVIGIDGGGTKTVCVVASLDGAELGRATGGPSNYQTIGAAATAAVLSETIAAAAGAAGGDLEARSLCLAMAGVDRPEDRRAVQDIAAGLIAQDTGDCRWSLA